MADAAVMVRAQAVRPAVVRAAARTRRRLDPVVGMAESPPRGPGARELTSRQVPAARLARAGRCRVARRAGRAGRPAASVRLLLVSYGLAMERPLGPKR